MEFIVCTGCPGKLRFTWKCILGEWLYNITKCVGRVYSVSKSSIGFSKVCENNYPRYSVQSDHMVAECGVKPVASSLWLKITKKVQVAVTMEDQIMAVKKWTVGRLWPECYADCSPCYMAWIAGYNGRVAKRKPLINKRNRKIRLQFTREHYLKQETWWQVVIFCDESKFNLSGSDGRIGESQMKNWRS